MSPYKFLPVLRRLDLVLPPAGSLPRRRERHQDVLHHLGGRRCSVPRHRWRGL